MQAAIVIGGLDPIDLFRKKKDLLLSILTRKRDA
jgi:hypothetical protein